MSFSWTAIARAGDLFFWLTTPSRKVADPSRRVERMFEMVDPGDLVTEIESTHRQESMLVARRMAAVAALLRHRVAATEQVERTKGYAEIDGFERTAAEVAAAMNLSPMAAS